MSASIPATSLQLRSLIKSSGELEISLASITTPEPGPEEVLVRIEASPMNPSDLGLLFGAADLSTAKASGTPERPVITATVPEKLMKGMGGRGPRGCPPPGYAGRQSSRCHTALIAASPSPEIPAPANLERES